MFETAAAIIQKHWRTAGESPVEGAAAQEVGQAVAMLEHVLARQGPTWQVLFFLGKARTALGQLDLAYDAYSRASAIEPEEDAIPRELAGVCLELSYFDEAVAVAQRAVALVPEDSELQCNLALAYLLAGKLMEAWKSIQSAVEKDPNDKITQAVKQVISDVASGVRPKPKTMKDLH